MQYLICILDDIKLLCTCSNKKIYNDRVTNIVINDIIATKGISSSTFEDLNNFGYDMVPYAGTDGKVHILINPETIEENKGYDIYYEFRLENFNSEDDAKLAFELL